MVRWSIEEAQARDWKNRKYLKDTYFLPDQPMGEGEEIESTLQKKVEQWCRDHGYPFLSFKQSKHAQRLLPAGWADMTIVIRDKVIFIELKSKTGRRSKEQKELALIFYHLGHIIHEVKTMKRFMEIINE